MKGQARVQEMHCLYPSILEFEMNEKVFTEKFEYNTYILLKETDIY